MPRSQLLPPSHPPSLRQMIARPNTDKKIVRQLYDALEHAVQQDMAAGGGHLCTGARVQAPPRQGPMPHNAPLLDQSDVLLEVGQDQSDVVAAEGAAAATPAEAGYPHVPSGLVAAVVPLYLLAEGVQEVGVDLAGVAGVDGGEGQARRPPTEVLQLMLLLLP